MSFTQPTPFLSKELLLLRKEKYSLSFLVELHKSRGKKKKTLALRLKVCIGKRISE